LELTRGPHMSVSLPLFSLFSPWASQCAVMASDASRSSPLRRCRRGGRSRFPGRRASPSRPRRLPELATCLTSLCASPCSPSPSFARHGQRLSSSCSSAESASSAPRISNPPQPKLDNLPSFLLDPSFASLIDQIAGNRSFSGRQPLKPPELHSAVELLPRVPVLFA